MIKIDSDNRMFELAVQLVNQGAANIFLTGKAGTGKTTFLKYIRENCPKRLAVVAPTGVAAINAGGMTIHSFFQLPISPFIPVSNGRNTGDSNDPHSLVSRLRMNSEKKKLLQELELLIIDEISMVRCDTLDAIDTVLRYVRSKPKELFGGVQLLFIGDMFQLPPVHRDQEWNILSAYYPSPYFFDSHVLRESKPIHIEFTKIYRQTEKAFINLLNQVRNNDLDQQGHEILESSYQPGFRRTKNDGYIILTSHNHSAREINSGKLMELEGPTHNFQADVENDFPPTAFPAEESLELKLGAQVMFIKNDPDKTKRYYNGKIGVVCKLEKDKIHVQCNGEDSPIEVKKERWENIRYSLNKSTRKLEEQLLGSFSQFPLRLAWAITIHKSQGLTFNKAIIDAGRSFAAGQVYVALSRCTNLDGMILHSRISRESLQTDPRILEFSKAIQSPDILERELEKARKSYREKLLLQLFDFRNIVGDLQELREYVLEHKAAFNPDTLSWLEQVLNKTNELDNTGTRFQKQLQQLFLGKEEAFLLERMSAAVAHFRAELSNLCSAMQNCPAFTDSRLHAKHFNEKWKEAWTGAVFKKHILDNWNTPFGLDHYHECKNRFRLPSASFNAYAGEGQKELAPTPHPELYRRLRKYRDQVCERKGLPLYLVAGSQTLQDMTLYLPQTLFELQKINGFGPARIRSYGQAFLDIILDYCEETGSSSRMDTILPKRERKQSKTPRSDTKAETLKMFQQGKTMDEIAGERKLTRQTIEGHLAHYVKQGIISIEGLVAEEKLAAIRNAVERNAEGTIVSIKNQLSQEISFGEIRLVMALIEFERSAASFNAGS